jgi:hypothetical protein
MNTYLKFIVFSALVGATFLGSSFSWAKTCTFEYSPTIYPTQKDVGSYNVLTCAECTTFAAFFHLPVVNPLVYTVERILSCS